MGKKKSLDGSRLCCCAVVLRSATGWIAKGVSYAVQILFLNWKALGIEFADEREDVAGRVFLFQLGAA